MRTKCLPSFSEVSHRYLRGCTVCINLSFQQNSKDHKGYWKMKFQGKEKQHHRVGTPFQGCHRLTLLHEQFSFDPWIWWLYRRLTFCWFSVDFLSQFGILIWNQEIFLAPNNIHLLGWLLVNPGNERNLFRSPNKVSASSSLILRRGPISFLGSSLSVYQ